MLDLMLWKKIDLKASHRKKVNAPSNMKLAISLMDLECHPCGIFEGLSYYQEDEAIDPTIFAAIVGLRDRINKFVSSNSMGMVRSVLVIFDTGATYSCSYNKGDSVKLENNMFPRNLKGMEHGLEISGFGIFKYSFRSEGVPS